MRATLAVLAFSILVTLPLRWIDPLTTSIILQRHAATYFEGKSRPRQNWVDRRQISSFLPVAVLAAEDQKFPDHFGFDFQSISSALDERGKRVRGASTITQQVAKNLYLWPGRSLFRKGIEAYFTLLLELFLPKARILEIYLNIAEFGPNVFGAEAASRLHFNRPAAELTDQQSALLAAILPNPARLSASDPSEYVQGRSSQIRAAAKKLGGPEFLSRIR